MKRLSSKAALLGPRQKPTPEREKELIAEIAEERARLYPNAARFLIQVELFHSRSRKARGQFYMTSGIPHALCPSAHNCCIGDFKDYFLAVARYCRRCGMHYRRPAWARRKE